MQEAGVGQVKRQCAEEDGAAPAIRLRGRQDVEAVGRQQLGSRVANIDEGLLRAEVGGPLKVLGNEMLLQQLGLNGGGLESVADFLIHTHDISELEVAPLVLVCARPTAADEATAPMDKTANLGRDIRVDPPPPTAPGCFGVTIIDDHIHFVGNPALLDLCEAEELDLDRQTGQAFQQIGASDLIDIGPLD